MHLVTTSSVRRVVGWAAVCAGGQLHVREGAWFMQGANRGLPVHTRPQQCHRHCWPCLGRRRLPPQLGVCSFSMRQVLAAVPCVPCANHPASSTTGSLNAMKGCWQLCKCRIAARPAIVSVATQNDQGSVCGAQQKDAKPSRAEPDCSSMGGSMLRCATLARARNILATSWTSGTQRSMTATTNCLQIEQCSQV